MNVTVASNLKKKIEWKHLSLRIIPQKYLENRFELKAIQQKESEKQHTGTHRREAYKIKFMIW